MIGGVLDYLIKNVHVGADRTVLGQLLSPARRPGQPLRVLAPGGHLARPLRAAGCELLVEGEAEAVDAVCAVPGPARARGSQGGAGDLAADLGGWARLVRPGGLVLLVSRRGHPAREAVCAAFLHAGLTEPVQRTAGMAVVTAGRCPGSARGPGLGGGSPERPAH